MRELIAVLAAGDATVPPTAQRAAACSSREVPNRSKPGRAEQVAAAIGISERQLFRVFAADGTSVPRHILSGRLHLVYSMLSSNSGRREPRPWPTPLYSAALHRQRTSPTPSTSVTEPATSAVDDTRESRLTSPISRQVSDVAALPRQTILRLNVSHFCPRLSGHFTNKSSHSRS